MSSNQNRINVDNLLNSLEREFTNFVYDYTIPTIENRSTYSIPTSRSRSNLYVPLLRQESRRNVAPGGRLEQVNMDRLLQQYNENIQLYQTNVSSIMSGYQENIQMYTSLINNIISALQNSPRDTPNGEHRNVSSSPSSSPSPSPPVAQTVSNTTGNNNISSNRQSTANTVLNHTTNVRNINNRDTTDNTTNNITTQTTSRTAPISNIILTYLATLPIHRRRSSEQTILTNEQITLSTQDIIYNTHLRENRCPISWENFQVGEQVCQIKHCGHIFNKSSLINWFSRNTVCPVCRYDITTYREPLVEEPREEQPLVDGPLVEEPREEEELGEEEYSETDEPPPLEEPTNHNETIDDIFERLIRNINRNVTTMYGTDTSNNLYGIDVTFETNL
jgi:E3 ubiquitin-protein ligase RNF181